MRNSAPQALLFTAAGCPHCPGVKAALEKLLHEGLLAGLEVVDVASDAARAAKLGVRSVPWLRLGEFTLTGAQTPQQLRQWAERAAGAEGVTDYLGLLLKEGNLAEAERLLADQPAQMPALLTLLQDEASPIQVRLGASAILEGYEGTTALRRLLPQLIALSRHPDHRLRSDACHLLGLSHDDGAREALLHCLEDENPEVREIAAESLESLATDAVSRDD